MVKRPVRSEDLFGLRFVTGADLSPDGRSVVYALSRVDPDANRESNDLFLADVGGGAPRQLTFTDAVHGAPVFSPDGKQVAFLSTRSGSPQLYAMPVDGGEARQVTDLARGVTGAPVWSPDGRQLAFTAGPQEEPRDPSLPYRVDRAIWRSEGIGLVTDAINDVYVIDAGGGEPRRLTNDTWMNTAPRWMPDGRSLVYLASHDPQSTSLASRLRTVTVDGETRDLTGADGVIMSHAVCPDGRVAYLLMFEQGRLPGSRGDLCLVDPATGVVDRRAGQLEGHLGCMLQPDMPSTLMVGQLLVSVDSRHAFVSVQYGGEVAIVEVGLRGDPAIRTVAAGPRCCAPIALAGQVLLFAGFDFIEPGDLYRLDLDTGTEHRVTAVNGDLLEELALPLIERVQFAGADGTPVEGWFWRPSGVEGPAPTVLTVHGGPHAGWGHLFHFDSLMLTGAGFGVLMVNHRGSTGYGDDFATAINFDWGNLDYTDLMAGVDHAISLGLADASKLGVFGVSGGGNLTGWIIGHTDRFKAACPENPLFNWTSMFGTSDAGPWMGQTMMGGQPHERSEVYQRCSPITFAHRCTTPTLFLQHDNDYRCPPEQTEQFYTVLRVNGVPAEMLRFPGTGHAGSVNGPITHRRAQNDAIVDWMNRYVLGKEPPANA